MSTESIIVEVKDNVDSSIAVKIRAISTESRNAQSDLNKLQNMLSQLSGSALNVLNKSLSSTKTELDKLAQSQKEVSNSSTTFNTINSQLSTALSSLTARVNLLSSAYDKSSESIKKVSRATKQESDDVADLLGKINPTVAALGRLDDMESKLNAHRKNGRIDLDTYTQYKQKLDETRTALGRVDDALNNNSKATNKAALSAKQLSFAMRGVPAQFTDIVVSLQGGQAPLTVLLQQGGQLKDMFGGVGNAAKALATYVAGLISPLTILAAVVAVVALAYKQGSDEISDFEKATTKTGNAIGLSSEQFGNLRDSLNDIGTKGKAAEVLTQIASAGISVGSQLENISRTAILMQKAFGTAIEDTISEFKKLSEDPVKASLELNKSYNYLTASVYEQIKALEEQHKTIEAVDLAEKTYADAMRSRSQEVLDNLGYIESGWLKIKDAAKGAWDRMLGIGRDKTSLQKLADLQSELAIAQNQVPTESGILGNNSRNTDAIQSDIDNLRETMRMIDNQQQLQDEYKSTQKAGIDAITRVEKQTASSLSKQQQLNKALSDYHKDLDSIRKANPDSKLLDPSTVSKTEANIREKFKTPATKEDKFAENRARALEKVNLQLDNQYKLQSMLGPEQEKQQQFDQINEGLVGRKIKLSDDESKSIKAKIAAIIDNNKVASEYNRIYNEAKEPQLQWNATLTASQKLLDEGKISQEEYSKALVKGYETIANIKNPLREYNKALNEQFALSKLLPDQQEIESKMLGIKNQLLSKGIDLEKEGNEEVKTAVEGIKQREQTLQQLNKVQNEYNSIYSQTAGALQKVTEQAAALNMAQQSGLLTSDQYNIKMNQLATSAAQIRINAGGDNPFDIMLASLGRLTEAYPGLISGMTTSFGDLFVTLEDGFANSIGKAIVYGDSLKESLVSVAQQGVAALISSLVKLGIQYVVNAALGQSIGASALAAQTATSSAAAAVTATAWAPAAALVSLASFGANSVPASAGILATTALSEGLALASVAGFAEGGYTGDMAANQIAGVVHGKEFVMDAAATSRIGVGNLEALQSGAMSLGSNGTSKTSSVGTGQISITIENTGTPQTYEQVQGITSDEVRLIAKDVMSKETPNLVAAQISDPNSKTRKALSTHTNVTRK